MGKSTNMLTSTDEIEAALAELDKLAPAKADEVPSLDDGSEAQEDADAADEAPVVSAAVSDPVESDPSAASPAETVKADPAGTCRAHGFHLTLERGLDTLNRPLTRFSSRVRNLVGFAAFVTLVVSVAAAIAAPYVLPHGGPVTFVQEKRAQLDAQQVGGVRGDGPLSIE